jgi:plastocyanin domain-containing protein
LDLNFIILKYALIDRKYMKIFIFGLIAGILILTSCANTPSVAELGENGEQIVRMAVIGPEFVPSEITVQAGKTVKLIVDGSKAYGCMKYFTIPSQKIDVELNSGENEFVFTPTASGNIPFSCRMNMAKGVIRVK